MAEYNDIPSNMQPIISNHTTQQLNTDDNGIKLQRKYWIVTIKSGHANTVHCSTF